MRIQTPRLAGAALIVVSALVSSGCGYALAGRGSFLPDHIKIIAIPAFVNRTTVFNLETMVTEKVRAEFISRGHYMIQPSEAGADAVLTGEINSVISRPSALDANQIASRYTITMTATALLKDSRDGKEVWQNRGLFIQQEYDAQTGQNALDPAAFFGQDANAMERLTSEFARAMVSSLLEAF